MRFPSFRPNPLPGMLLGAVLLGLGLKAQESRPTESRPTESRPTESLSPAAYRLLDAAYGLQKSGDPRGALAKVEEALVLQPQAPQLRIFQVQLLVETGSPSAARTHLEALLRERPLDGVLHLQRAFLLQQSGSPAEATLAVRRALDCPGLDPESVRSARLTLADLLLVQGLHREALEALLPLVAERSAALQNRRGYVLLGAGNPREAAEAFRLSLDSQPGAEERRSALYGLRDAAAKASLLDLEIQALQGLCALLPENRDLPRDLGYALSRAGRDKEAYRAFRSALVPASSSNAWLDAAYAAKRVGLNVEALEAFTRGAEALNREPATDPKQHFALRREAEVLSRGWGAVLGTSYRQGGLLPGLVSEQKVLQQGAEVYYQPAFFSRNGRLVQLFVQGFQTLSQDGQGPTGSRTLQASAGLRVKPFSQQNLVLTAQKLFPGGEFASREWLLRAAYSADGGADLKPGQRRWNAWTLYTEGAAFLDSGRYVHSLEASWGQRLAPFSGLETFSVTPHFVLGADYDNRSEQRSSSGLGAGLSFRQWFRQTPTKAPASWADLSLQYRFKLGSGDRNEGFFLRFTLWI